MRTAFRILALLAVAPTLASAQLVRSGTGATPTDAGLLAALAAFRTDLGTLNGNAPGPLPGGRREINWDGGGAAVTAPAPSPFTGFTVTRGATFSTPGTGFEQNAEGFANLDASYATTFAAFSPQRLFAAIGSNVVDVAFSIPGGGAQAVTRGFGAVFSDVDLANTTSLQLFDAQGGSLGTFFVPALVGSQTFSFLGVSFGSARVSRVRITAGNAALGPGVLDRNGNGADLVVIDDMVYGEPTVVIPEPATLVLTAGGLLLLAAARRRRA